MAGEDDAPPARPTTPLPTDPEAAPVRAQRRARTVRRITVGALVAFVAAGAVGVFGYRTGSVSAGSGGYELRLSYPSIARPGLPIRWILHLHRTGGLPEKVTIATSIGYLDLLDVNDLQPQPDSTTTTDEAVLWTFSPPRGEDMTIALDAIVAPSAHGGAHATTSLMEAGRAVAEVEYGTAVMP